MAAIPRFSLAQLDSYTRFAPLVALGYFIREQELLSPLFSRIKFPTHLHTVHPTAALIDLWVSILAGCRSVSQINTQIRPDRLLAQAWGRECFCEQSTIARVLDACQSEQVSQLRAGIQAVHRWIGQATRHPWELAPLVVDIDLTGLPAGRQAEGSTKGYFSGKRGLADGSYAASQPRIMTRASHHCFTRETG